MKHHLCRILLLILSVSLLNSCKESKKEEQQTRSTEDSLGIVYEDSVYIIDNEYTKIKNSLCEKIEFTDLNFTNANTQIYSLDPTDSTRKFLFISEIECGFTSGNCGTSIDIIERKGKKYSSILKVCGKLDSIAPDLSYFEYITFTNRKFRVGLNSHKPQGVLISVHNMPYTDLQSISKLTDITEDNLILKGEKTENMDAVPVIFIQEQVGNDLAINIYKLDNFGTKYGFIFVHNKHKPSAGQQIGGKGDLKIIEDKQDIVIELANSGVVEKWKFNVSKKIFVLL